jgi:hypothetical protein
VGGISDDGLVEVADFDFDFAVGVGDGAEVADVTVAADPDGRALGEFFAGVLRKPLVELERVAAYVGVGRTGHLETAAFFKHSLTVRRGNFNDLDRHCYFDAKLTMAVGARVDSPLGQRE